MDCLTRARSQRWRLPSLPSSRQSRTPATYLAAGASFLWRRLHVKPRSEVADLVPSRSNTATRRIGRTWSALDLDTINQTFFNGLSKTTPHGQAGDDLIGYMIPFEEWPEEVKKGYQYDSLHTGVRLALTSRLTYIR